MLSVTDRFYSSTCAYTTGTATSSKPTGTVADLPSIIFRWPHDLIQPCISFVPQVPHEVRERRVLKRGNSDEIVAGNTWEDRRRQTQKLGEHIMQAYPQVLGPEVVPVNATGSRIMSKIFLQQTRVHFLHKLPVWASRSQCWWCY